MSIEISENKGRVEAHLTRVSDGIIFRQIAHTIITRFGGKWIKQLDGFDQRYWDLKIKGKILTLHLEHYTGIYLFPHHETRDLKNANSLVREIAMYLSEKFDGEIGSA